MTEIQSYLKFGIYLEFGYWNLGIGIWDLGFEIIHKPARIRKGLRKTHARDRHPLS